MTAEDGRLVVTNSLLEKPKELVDEGGTGLANISQRYSYFTDETVEADKTVDMFKVSVPLIEIETI